MINFLNVFLGLFFEVCCWFSLGRVLVEYIVTLFFFALVLCFFFFFFLFCIFMDEFLGVISSFIPFLVS